MTINSTLMRMIETSLRVELLHFGRTLLEPHHCPPHFAVRGIMGMNRFTGGRMVIRLDGGPTVKLADGDAVILPESIPIWLDNLDPGRVISQWHDMRYRILSSLSPCDLLLMPVRLPSRHAERIWEINSRLFRMARSTKTDFLSAIAREHAIAIELLLIILEASKPRSDAVDILRRHNRLQPLLHVMEASIAQPLSTAKLASLVHLSEPRFFEVFRQSMGMPPGRYLQQLRLRKAQELLLMSDKQVQEIAQQTGYPDQFHFSRLFKKRFGVSPLGYRRQFSGS